jgi:hypothetical protein
MVSLVWTSRVSQERKEKPCSLLKVGQQDFADDWVLPSSFDKIPVALLPQRGILPFFLIAR